MTGTQTGVERPANAITVRPFRLLWLNNICFFLVSNAQRFVFGWLVLDGLNRSESDQGVVVFTLGLPSALLVLQAGVWADRWDRRSMLIWTQVAGGAVMAVTALLIRADALSFNWVIIVTLFAGAASAIGLIGHMIDHYEANAPTAKRLEAAEVGRAAPASPAAP